VEHPVWSFVRGADRLEISREDVDDGVMLIVAGDGAPRSYFFRDPDRLEVFQRDMETLLLKTGWSFVDYTPEKRRGRDRRGWPRKANDRRRWWTDGAQQPGEPKLKDESTPGDSSVEERRALLVRQTAAQPKSTRST
jgi:hypothetical protein